MKIRIPLPISWGRTQTSRIKWHSEDRFDEDTTISNIFRIIGIPLFNRVKKLDVKHDTSKTDKKTSAGFK